MRSRLFPILSLMIFATACASTPPASTTPDEDPEEPSVEVEMQIIEDEVEFRAADRTIYGSFTRPSTPGPHRALLLIAGSGPTDRNWESPLLPGEHGSARLLAHELTQNGWIVLRYDKLGTGQTAIPDVITFQAYEEEQQAGLAFLAEREDVRNDGIFVAGHSEGGLHALRLAPRARTELAGVILMATAGRSLQEVIIWQIEKQLKGAGLDDAAITAHSRQLGQALDAIVNEEDVDPAQASEFPGVQQLVASLLNPVALPFTREVLAADPRALIAQLDVPVLIVNGDKDIQVHHAHDAAVLDEAAQVANGDVQLRIIPNADHVFKEETTPLENLDANAGLRYNAQGRNLAPTFVEVLIEWMTAR